MQRGEDKRKQTKENNYLEKENTEDARSLKQKQRIPEISAGQAVIKDRNSKTQVMLQLIDVSLELKICAVERLVI